MVGRSGPGLGLRVLLALGIGGQLLLGTAWANCRDYLATPPGEWNLKLRGWSIYAVREEVRKLAELVEANLQENYSYSEEKYPYYEVSGEDQGITWEMRVKVLPADGNTYKGHVSLKRSKYSESGGPRFPTLEATDLDVFGKNVANYLGNLLRLTRKSYSSYYLSKDVVTQVFRDYQDHRDDDTYAYYRKRPIDLNHSQGRLIDHLDNRDEQEMRDLISRYRPAKWAFFETNDAWAYVASRTLITTSSKYVSYEERVIPYAQDQQKASFMGSFWYPDGNAYHILLEDVGKGIPTRIYGLGTNRGFITSIRKLKIDNPVMYIYRESYRGGPVAEISPSAQRRNYYANLDYPQKKTLRGLREALNDFVQGKNINFREISYSGNGPYAFELAVPGYQRESTRFREVYRINRFGDDPSNGFYISRTLIFNNPYTGKEMEVEVPVRNFSATGRQVGSFDSLFEEIAQILGDFLIVSRES